MTENQNKLLQKSPVLFWALHFLIGCALSLHPHWAYIFPLVLLALLSKRKFQGWALLAAGFIYTSQLYTLPEAKELNGTGIFALEAIQPSQSPFHRSYILKGSFKTFESDGKSYCNIPCVIFQNFPPKSGSKWLLEGKLQNKQRFVFKPSKDLPWKELDNPFSLAQYRFQKKQEVRKYFHSRFSDKKVAHFFSSMATGDIDDWLLAMEFRKVGLGHILAISGLHFALLAAMIGWMLRAFLPQMLAYFILLSLLGFYFLFLGMSPSVLRSFIMISFYVLGLILKRRIDALNLLGLALLVELILDPMIIQHVGFQLSFLATMGILLFYAPCERFIEPLLPKRKMAELNKLSLIDQHAVLITTAIRKASALNLSVLLTTLPATLFVFHTFPLLSIPFNLFLTPLLGISLMLIPIGVLLPPLGHLNAIYTGWLLELIANPPEIVNFKIFLNSFPFALVVILTALIGSFGLTKRMQKA